MQKLIFQPYFGLLLILSFVASCVPEPVEGGDGGNDGALTLNFRATYDSIPVVMGNSNQTFLHNGDLIYFTDFRFFVSNVGLENKTTTDLTLIVDDDEVWQFNMPDNEPSAEIGDFKNFLTQPGEYKGIRIDFGVPAELNTSVFDSNVFGSANPLADSDNFSSEFKSYKFLELKGIADGKLFNYRIGKDQFYTDSVDLFAKSFILTSETNDASIKFKIDLKKVLEGVKISENFTLKQVDLPTLGKKIMDNFTKNSIELE